MAERSEGMKDREEIDLQRKLWKRFFDGMEEAACIADDFDVDAAAAIRDHRAKYAETIEEMIFFWEGERRY
jgi:hypothetical protein